MDNEEFKYEAEQKSYTKLALWLVGIFAVIGCLAYFILSAPAAFPDGSIVNIEPGLSLRGVSFKLERLGVIRSRVAFEIFAILYGGEKHLTTGDYLLDSHMSVIEIARRIAKGDKHLAPVKITIPEGYNLNDMANAFSLRLGSFNKQNFLQQAKYKEGYLFPDTYFFLITDTERQVIKSMSDNFDKKIESLKPTIDASGKTKEEIIIIASLIEKEAKGENDRAIISGILWRRLSLGMPLQVDVAPITYKKKGLPDTPVASPGLAAINAAINPKNSNYLYYLHDKEGGVHFASSFDEHKANIAKYLK